MPTSLVVLIGLVGLIIIHELGHFLSAKWLGVKVEEFGIGFPPRLLGKKIGETLYSLNWLPFGGFVRLFGELPDFDGTGEDDNVSPAAAVRSFRRQPVWRRSIIIVAGVIMNVIAAWVLFTFVFMVGTSVEVVVIDVLPDSPAEAAGLKAGDKLPDFATADDFSVATAANAGQDFSFSVRRGDEDLTLSAVPRVEHAVNEGALGAAVITSGLPRTPWLLSFWESLKYTFSMLLVICLAFVGIISQLLAGLDPGVVGPIGVFSVASDVGQNGTIFIIHLIAVISLNLAVLNILPLPALDGGRLILLLVEKFKGSPVSPKFEAYTNAAGFILLILLMVLVTVKDIYTFF